MKRRILLGMVIAAVCMGCESRRSTSADVASPPAVTDTLNLPMPVIPDSVTELGERAAILTQRFWETLDFANDKRALDTVFIEQNFVNFAAMLSATSSDDGQMAVDIFVNKASVSEAAFSLIRFVVDKYLDDPNSPMRNEDLYLLFLKNYSGNMKLTPEERLVADEKSAMAMKNRTGTIASDFCFDTREGRHTSLHEQLVKGENVVMFYDSDCEHCKEIIARLEKSPVSTRARVIALDVAGNRRLWEVRQRMLPADWIVGFVTDAIEKEERYVFRALPTFYILDESATVLLKDPSPALLL